MRHPGPNNSFEHIVLLNKGHNAFNDIARKSPFLLDVDIANFEYFRTAPRYAFDGLNNRLAYVIRLPAWALMVEQVADICLDA